MDARSIAATAANGGRITAATDVEYTPIHHEYHFDKEVYDNRLYYGFGKADPSVELVMGPNITDWPKMYDLTENLLVELAAVIHDPVTTTDELIPSGETSSYRSNPLRLAEFTLSRRVPEYVPRAKDVAAREAQRRSGQVPASLLETLGRVGDAQALAQTTQFGSCVFANKPGDGSAREQAASCQKVLGASPTSAMSTPPSAIAATASTGASCPLPSTRARPSIISPATACLSPASAPPSRPDGRISPPRSSAATAAPMTCCSTSGA